MTIGAVSFQPYVYNVNAISPASMNRLSRISDNVLDKKTDFSELVENENPLKKGQTLNFQNVLEMQMQRGWRNAARVLKPAQNEQEPADMAAEQTNETQETARTQNAAVNFGRINAVQSEQEAAVGDVQTAAFGNGADNGAGNFRMQQAIDAYQMFMTA